MVEILEYVDERGDSPFQAWFADLDAPAAARVVTRLARIESGNFSNVEGVGEGVFEAKIEFGQGYRIYFGKDGVEIVILLGGGGKKRQQQDIEFAHRRWADYKRRKKE